jgi:hypothetical protein
LPIIAPLIMIFDRRLRFLRPNYGRERRSSVGINDARVAKLADAPDLGFQNRRFQNVPFRFKKQSIYEGKTRLFTIRAAFTIGE